MLDIFSNDLITFTFTLQWKFKIAAAQREERCVWLKEERVEYHNGLLGVSGTFDSAKPSEAHLECLLSALPCISYRYPQPPV